MKIVKKISAVLLALCLCATCFSLTAYAAAGAMLSVFVEEVKGAAKKTEKIRQEYEKNDRR